ncbi:MAG: ribonuclease Y [Clostridiales bacterium]|jgi:ribonuclease Y|nr:ribonuclease Y [Clostridiales bacterium]
MITLPPVWAFLVVILMLAAIYAAFRFGISYRKKIAEAEIGGAEKKAQDIINQAKAKAENKRREVLLEAKEEIIKNKAEADKEVKTRREEISRQENRLVQKEETLDKKTTALEEKTSEMGKLTEELENKLKMAEETYKKQVGELERISGLTAAEAKAGLIETIKSEARLEAAQSVKKIEDEAREDAEKRAREIISGAIQRCSSDHVAETTVSVVPIPNDEMKGRIIGREGRNIRTIESLTGIDLVIDDTPEAVILSGFDPIRREIARLTLEKLIVDGRIHPARIEETFERSKKEVEQIIKQEGEQATFDTGVHGLHPELVRLIGRLKYRTSYGQNVLKHSIEVSHLAGLMAGELGEDVMLAKRTGLLHDIGKAIDQEQDGSHVTIGANIAKKYKENDAVVHGILAHHGDIEPQTIVAVLVQAADAVSAARPGARRENVETYIKRLQQLESIANSFTGVDRSFAIQAGREIRIMVKPEAMSDSSTVMLAKDVVKKIESEMEYPGQIKVHVIRELRAIEYAS